MAVLEAHVRDRYPAFETADVVVETGDWPHHVAVDAIVRALAAHAAARGSSPAASEP
jgi:shikimate kinase